MNLDKLEVGQVFKSYRSLCLTLGEKVKTGEGKIKQIADWLDYFEYERIEGTNRYRIAKMYSEDSPSPFRKKRLTPKEKIEKRKRDTYRYARARIQKEKENLHGYVYKIFHQEGLVYVGMTLRGIKRRLYAHVPQKTIDFSLVTKIEYARIIKGFCAMYETYFIAHLKPLLNKKQGQGKILSYGSLPEPLWQTFEGVLGGHTFTKEKTGEESVELRQS